MKKTDYLAFALLLIFLFVLSARLQPYAFDDAYIHFRIAENLASLGQPYFEPGEPIMATSSPVWTGLLAALAWLGLSLPSFTPLLNALLTAAGTMVWFCCLRALDEKAPKWVAWVFSAGYAGIMLPSCAGLMEAPLAMLLLGLALWSLYREKAYGWAFLSAAIFTRLELVVFIPFFAAPMLSGRRVSMARQAACFAGVFILMAAALWFFYGTLIPHTAKAKQVVYSLSREFVFWKAFMSLVPVPSFPLLASPFVDGFLRVLRQAWIPEFLLLLAVVLAKLPWKMTLKSQKIQFVMAVGAGGTAIFSAYVFKRVFLHEWYEPLFAIPLLFFLFGFYGRSGVFHKALLATFLILPLSALTQYSMGAWDPVFLAQDVKAPGARVQRYMEAGKILYGMFPDARLMTSEIGGLGYAFKGKILDGVGLITPEALRRHPMEVGVSRSDATIGAIPPQYIEDEKPELIVAYSLFVEAFVESPGVADYCGISAPAFSREYEIKTRETKLWGHSRIFVFLRKDVADFETCRMIAKEMGVDIDHGN